MTNDTLNKDMSLIQCIFESNGSLVVWNVASFPEYIKILSQLQPVKYTTFVWLVSWYLLMVGSISKHWWLLDFFFFSFLHLIYFACSAGGMALSTLVPATVSSITLLAKSSVASLQIWSLHGLLLTIEAAGLSFVSHVQVIQFFTTVVPSENGFHQVSCGVSWPIWLSYYFHCHSKSWQKLAALPIVYQTLVAQDHCYIPDPRSPVRNKYNILKYGHLIVWQLIGAHMDTLP